MQTPVHQDADARFVAELTRCQAALEMYVRGLMPGETAVEEIVQQANARIWEKRREFKPGTHFRAWALAVTRFEVLNYRKQCARDARLKFSHELETTIASEIADLDDDMMDRHSALRECLQKLRPESRELLMSRYGSQESLAEFAGRVGRSVGGLKVSLSRLRNSLCDCIERRMKAEGGLE